MKKRFLCILLAVLMVLTGLHAPEVQAAEDDAVSNANISINSTNFPDEAFRNWIIQNLDVSGSASSGYYLTQAKADAVTNLSLTGVGITNPKGVEKFVNLERLVLWNNSVTTLDVTKNTKLTYLDLDNNQLTKLDLSKNVNLQTLYLSGNHLAYLRLANNKYLTSLSSGSTQSISNKVGAKVGTTYCFDLSTLIPVSNLKYVTMNGGHTLNKSTGKVTLTGEVSSFSYTFNTGNSDVGSITVNVGIDSYTTVSKPKITTQPASKTVSVDETASFTVKASGGTDASPLKYQWQYKTPSGEWTNCSSKTTGYNKATLKVVGTSARNGYQYRCIIKNVAGSVTSTAVKLTVSLKPKITSQPSGVDAALNETVSFTVKATGNDLKYQWQYRKSSSGSWTNCTSKTTGYNKATLKVVATAARSGYQYRCRVKNSYGTVYSKAATLTAGKPIIKTQPANVTAAKGSTAEISVTVKGGGLKFQWYYRTSASGTWKKVSTSNASTYQMITSVLQVPVTKTVHGYQYRCVITNKYGKATSKAATLLVKNGPVITKQPAAKTAYDGDTVSFTVTVTGTSPKYQWQYKTPSGSWTNCTSKTTGYRSKTLKVKATEARDGYQYRCVISNDYGKVTSKAVKLTVKPATTAYRALLIGESGFGDGTRNQCDADHMAAMLASIKGPNGRNYTSTTMYNLDAEEVRAAIQSTFAATKDFDVSLFFIATHGNSDGDGELLMDDYGTLDFGTLADWLNQYIKGKVIVVIESCGSGSAIYEGNSADAKAADELLVQKAIEAFARVDEAEMENAGVGAMRQSKFYVLAASAHHQMSWGHEGGSGSGNYFTDWLIEGIGSSGHMPADTNNDNYVTLNELYTYISQYDTVTFQGSYTQQVQVYPTNSSYKLFKR
ncbi:MAG: immunoglobulin domain-containing protein [Lachnospiraceae bacterium]|nr:immunoglobulin domain-containing protein [Lachnospiraceae bacterium]